jgi:hypothetical protein
MYWIDDPIISGKEAVLIRLRKMKEIIS